MRDLQKLENYYYRYNTLKTTLVDDLRELMQQCHALSDAHDFIEDETYKTFPPRLVKECMWSIIGTLDEHIIFKQNVKVKLDTLLLINSRIKKIAKIYGLNDLLETTLDNDFLNKMIKALSDEEIDRELRLKVTKVIEEME